MAGIYSLLLFVTRKKGKKGLLMHLFHNLKPGNLIVGSHCTCPTKKSDCFGQKLPYFIPEGKLILFGLTDNYFGCQVRAELLDEGHLCLTETIGEEKCTEI